MQELKKILEEIDIKIAESMGKKREGLLEAREIIRKRMNDGWISVEERLPTKEECKKDNNNFLVQVDSGERFSCEYDPEANGYDNPQWCCNIPVVPGVLFQSHTTRKGASMTDKERILMAAITRNGGIE